MARRGGRAARARKKPARVSFAAAFAVHIFTALGAAYALLALLAAGQRDFVTMFWWLGAALITDGIDGTFARRLDVARVAQRWSGDVLDFVVDFTTYVFVPAYALAVSGVLPPNVSTWLACGIVVSSALYFADREMKTSDYFFKGFPALWNGVAFHIFLLKPEPWIAAAGIVALIVMTFLPIRFVHPMRVARLQGLTIAVLVLWSALSIYSQIAELAPPWPIGALATICAVYLMAIGAAMKPSR